MNELNVWHFIGVFVAMAITDLIWALYIRRVGQGKAAQAGLAASLLLVVGAFVITSYVENHWYLLPAAIGSFLGTFAATKIDCRAKTIKNNKKP